MGNLLLMAALKAAAQSVFPSPKGSFMNCFCGPFFKTQSSFQKAVAHVFPQAIPMFTSLWLCLLEFPRRPGFGLEFLPFSFNLSLSDVGVSAIAHKDRARLGHAILLAAGSSTITLGHDVKRLGAIGGANPLVIRLVGQGKQGVAILVTVQVDRRGARLDQAPEERNTLDQGGIGALKVTLALEQCGWIAMNVNDHGAFVITQNTVDFAVLLAFAKLFPDGSFPEHIARDVRSEPVEIAFGNGNSGNLIVICCIAFLNSRNTLGLRDVAVDSFAYRLQMLESLFATRLTIFAPVHLEGNLGILIFRQLVHFRRLLWEQCALLFGGGGFGPQVREAGIVKDIELIIAKFGQPDVPATELLYGDAKCVWVAVATGPFALNAEAVRESTPSQRSQSSRTRVHFECFSLPPHGLHIGALSPTKPSKAAILARGSVPIATAASPKNCARFPAASSMAVISASFCVHHLFCPIPSASFLRQSTGIPPGASSRLTNSHAPFGNDLNSSENFSWALGENMMFTFAPSPAMAAAPAPAAVPAAIIAIGALTVCVLFLPP
ncbi:hypothetical protein N7492_007123 [Penicillium capsulatum]|uniref:Uncharacterized protein n=1 Tax=Penicillium capsulatum TaxID=69766 RepID=A0A9W9LLT0_9EURO|nr:hypothetical protein N7492_007123 [Penicillium capsulatum]KAJ6116960.1 hypothetical protein N7512_006685 [Penicillium capsulatum]